MCGGVGVYGMCVAGTPSGPSWCRLPAHPGSCSILAVPCCSCLHPSRNGLHLPPPPSKHNRVHLQQSGGGDALPALQQQCAELATALARLSERMEKRDLQGAAQPVASRAVKQDIEILVDAVQVLTGLEGKSVGVGPGPGTVLLG